MNMLIATPAYNGMVTAQYTGSIVAICRMFSERGIAYGYRTANTTDVAVARNYFGSLCLSDEAVSHLLFVDADMGFRASLVSRMLDFGQDFVSAAYVKRGLDLRRLLEDATPEDLAGPAQRRRLVARHQDFTGVPLADSDGRVELRHGFARFAVTGMGLCLLARGVFEEMVRVGVAERQKVHATGAKFPIYGFFDQIGEDGLRMSEDHSFCRRWVQGCGRDVWACVDEPIVHVGPYEFVGVYLDKIAPAS